MKQVHAMCLFDLGRIPCEYPCTHKHAAVQKLSNSSRTLSKVCQCYNEVRWLRPHSLSLAKPNRVSENDAPWTSRHKTPACFNSRKSSAWTPCMRTPPRRSHMGWKKMYGRGLFLKFFFESSCSEKTRMCWQVCRGIIYKPCCVSPALTRVFLVCL